MRLREIIAAALAVFLISTADPGRAATVTAGPTTFASTLAAAKCGDTVLVYGTFTLPRMINVKPTCPVVVDFTNATVAMSPTGYWTDIANLTFRGPVGYMRIDRSQDVRLDGVAASGAAPTNQSLITMGASVRLVVVNSTFSNTWKGLMLNGAKDALVAFNTFTGMSSDGINVSGWSNVRIEDNVFKQFTPPRIAPDGTYIDHPDCAQGYTGAWSYPVVGLYIRRNRCEAQWGQGYFTQDTAAVGLDTIVIEDNYAITGLPRAVSTQAAVVRNSAHRRNIIDTWPGSKYQALRYGTTGVVACGNQIAPYNGRPGITEVGC